mgnify:FL=1
MNGSYNFSNAATQAYGSNEIDMGGGVYAIYNGDMSRDGFIDNFDFPIYETDKLGFLSGYYDSDLNGDGFIDNFDFPIWDENNFLFVGTSTP